MKECPVCRACADDSCDQCPHDGTALVATIRGSRLLDAKYRLEQRLGAGGMGVVYRARHVNLHRDVAVKLIGSAHAALADRFRVEAAALGRLKHPHIVDVTDFGVEEARGVAYLVMQLLEGVTLESRLQRPLDRTNALRILRELAEGVDFAHRHGILHRDLKPANIFLVQSSHGESVKILDFGLAQFMTHAAAGERGGGHRTPNPAALVAPEGSNTTTTIVDARGPRSPRDAYEDVIELQKSDRGLVMGTRAYMAPELFHLEPARPATDLFALGVIAYEMLTGSLPGAMSGAPPGVTQPSDAVRRMPPEVEAPVRRLLESDPQRRPLSARDAVAAIGAAEGVARVREWRQREGPRRRMAALAIAAVATVAAALSRGAPIDRFERPFVDARFSLANLNPPHPSLLLVVLDDRSVDADTRPLALRADEFGATLNRVFAAGATAVAIDLLLPNAWSVSSPFAELIARHADRLTLAAFSTDDGRVLGPECLPGLVPEFLGADRAAALFGFVNVEPESDGVTRHVRLHYRDTTGGVRPTWAARAASTAGAYLAAAGPARDRIDYRVDADAFQRVSWQDVARLADTDPGLFRDRIVLVGGEFAGSGDDNRPTLGPGRRARSASGLVLQALSVNTIMNGFPIRESGRAVGAASAGLIAGPLTFFILMRRRLAPALAFAAVATAIYLAAAFVVFTTAQVLWPIANPMLAVGLALLAAVLMRARWRRPPEGARR